MRVAERPIQKEGIISFPIYNEKGKIEVVSFLKNDPDLMLQTHALSVTKERELSDYDVLLTIGFKYRRYSLQR